MRIIKEDNVSRFNETSKKSIAELEAEIAKQDAVLNTFQHNSEIEKKEMLNQIAGKLKAEYRDFKDSLDMEMTLDLGENLRVQLESVFKILIKNGVNLK